MLEEEGYEYEGSDAANDDDCCLVVELISISSERKGKYENILNIVRVTVFVFPSNRGFRFGEQFFRRLSPPPSPIILPPVPHQEPLLCVSGRPCFSASGIFVCFPLRPRFTLKSRSVVPHCLPLVGPVTPVARSHTHRDPSLSRGSSGTPPSVSRPPINKEIWFLGSSVNLRGRTPDI